MTTTVNISKAALLQATNQGLNFYNFVNPQLIKSDEYTCENTHNPFYTDKIPSFSIYFSQQTGRWMFKDHGGSPDGKDYSGDVFEFARLYYEMEGLDLKFGQLLRKIVDDLGIDPATVESNVETYTSKARQSMDSNAANYEARDIGFDLLSREYTECVDDALVYFSQYGIGREILLQYNVKAVKRYLYVDGEGTLQATDCRDKLVISYEDVYYSKMYTPNPKAFWFVGEKVKDYLFGFNQLLCRNRREKNYERDILIVAGGEKDVLALTSLGYDAVCFNSETAAVPKRASEVLFHWYRRIVVMYDNDVTGVKESKEIVKKFKNDFNVIAFEWPEELKDSEVKDISDYMAIGADVVRMRTAIEACGLTATDEMLAEEPATCEQLPIASPPLDAGEDNSPLIPEQVHSNLPRFLKHLCDQFDDPREKDLVLMSTLGVASSFFPAVHGRYDGSSVGLNLFLFVTAPSASGKHVMTWSRGLGGKVQNYLKEKYRSEVKEYMKAKEDPDAGPLEKPQLQTMFIPANTSVSKIIQLMGANGNFGVIMETEADTLAAAFKNEWSNFSDVLRKVFHHETVSLARRGNDEFVEIEKPHLSVVLSGTNNQVSNLLESVENGFFSRFLFYDFRPKRAWKDKFGEQDNCLDSIFEEAASTMLSWWEAQYGKDKTQIVLQNHQRAKANAFFATKLDQLCNEFGDPIEASVKRFCLICYRISMLLATFRALETADWLPTSLIVEDRDFECAFTIVDTLLVHLQRVYTRLEDASRTSKLKAQPRVLYEALPEDFSREQYNSIAEGLKIKFKTAERYLNVIGKQGLLERYEQGKYRKM